MSKVTRERVETALATHRSLLQVDLESFRVDVANEDAQHDFRVGLVPAQAQQRVREDVKGTKGVVSKDSVAQPSSQWSNIPLVADLVSHGEVRVVWRSP